MSEESVMRRIGYAKKVAKQSLEDQEHTVLNSDNQIICFTATFGEFLERKIRIVIDEITEHDIKLIKGLNITPNQTKEIWCKIKDISGFKRMIFNKDNKPIKKFSFVNREFPYDM